MCLHIVGCPQILRADYGTENCHLATAQIAFRTNGCDDLAGDKSFRYGKSTSNTVLECLPSKELVKLHILHSV